MGYLQEMNYSKASLASFLGLTDLSPGQNVSFQRTLLPNYSIDQDRIQLGFEPSIF